MSNPFELLLAEAYRAPGAGNTGALLLGGDVPSFASEATSDGAVELTATVAFTRRGAETKLVLPQCPRSRFVAESALEEDGFELSVPPVSVHVHAAKASSRSRIVAPICLPLSSFAV